MLRHTSAEVSTMPIPLLLAAAFGLGNAMKKEKKKRAVSKYTFIPLLLFIGTHSVLASPVPYTMDFNLSSGSILPTSGSFTYDSSTSTFTSFDVEWDGDTFVIDTVGFIDNTWVDHFGDPHSDEMKLQERYRRVDQNNMELTVTLTDPKIYTKPWVGDKKTFRLEPKTVLAENFCVPSEEELFNKRMRDPAGGKK